MTFMHMPIIICLLTQNNGKKTFSEKQFLFSLFLLLFRTQQNCKFYSLLYTTKNFYYKNSSSKKERQVNCNEAFNVAVIKFHKYLAYYFK